MIVYKKIINSYPAFDDETAGIRTHSRYVGNIYLLLKSKNLIFNLEKDKYTSFEDEINKKIVKKLGIVQYTIESIKKECEYSKIDEDFLPLALSWLWIKGYYAIFHLLAILIALEKSDDKYIFDKKYNSHQKIIIVANELLSKKPFNLNELNGVFCGSDLEKFITKNHENLKPLRSFDQNLYKLSIKKVFKDNKKKNGIKEARQKQYSIFNFCLNYREMFNYSGFHYIETEVEQNQEEIRKLYFTSHFVILNLVNAIVEYLSKKTDRALHDKLLEIK